MGGTGPTAKHPSARRRRNRTSTAAILERRNPYECDVPDLPDRDGEDEFVGWHAQAVKWWRDLWRSPMSSEFDDSDIHGLNLLVMLVDQFWKSGGDPGFAREIRLQRRAFGLTPMDRRSLGWTIEPPDDDPKPAPTPEPEQPKKSTRTRAKKAAPAAAKPDDPRRHLKAV